MEREQLKKGVLAKVIFVDKNKQKQARQGKIMKTPSKSAKTVKLITGHRDSKTNQQFNEILQVSINSVTEIIEEGSKLWEALAAFFSRLPYQINEGSKTYYLTERRGKNGLTDFVSYEEIQPALIVTGSKDAKINILAAAQAETMKEAKHKLKEELKVLGYL